MINTKSKTYNACSACWKTRPTKDGTPTTAWRCPQHQHAVHHVLSATAEELEQLGYRVER